jgi:hypothetical protein
LDASRRNRGAVAPEPDQFGLTASWSHRVTGQVGDEMSLELAHADLARVRCNLMMTTAPALSSRTKLA